MLKVDKHCNAFMYIHTEYITQRVRRMALQIDSKIDV